ncbi:MAG: hypothetical protein ACWIPH_07245 [Ostreibacterium sp.]
MVNILRIMTALLYCVIGLLIAFPLSYYFQSDIYKEMSLLDYLINGKTVIVEGAQFGSVDVLRRVAYVSMIICLIIGKLIEKAIVKSCLCH